MTADQTLRLFEIANRYFKNEADARVFIQEIEVTVDKKFEDTRSGLATKQDFVALDGKMSGLETKIASVEAKISDTKAELMRWMFAMFTPFYIGMIVFLIKQFL